MLCCLASIDSELSFGRASTQAYCLGLIRSSASSMGANDAFAGGLQASIVDPGSQLALDSFIQGHHLWDT